MDNFDVMQKFFEGVEVLRKFDRYEKALKDIKQHMEFAVPTGYKMSGVWNLANNALNGDKENV